MCEREKRSKGQAAPAGSLLAPKEAVNVDGALWRRRAAAARRRNRCSNVEFLFCCCDARFSACYFLSITICRENMFVAARTRFLHHVRAARTKQQKAAGGHPASKNHTPLHLQTSLKTAALAAQKGGGEERARRAQHARARTTTTPLPCTARTSPHTKRLQRGGKKHTRTRRGAVPPQQAFVHAKAAAGGGPHSAAALSLSVASFLR